MLPVGVRKELMVDPDAGATSMSEAAVAAITRRRFEDMRRG
jgi:hypothetical protein